jgi:hypothetical protein
MQKKVYQKKKEKKKIIVIFQNRKFELDFVGRQEESPSSIVVFQVGLIS